MLSLVIAIIAATAGQILLSDHDLRGLVLYALAIFMLWTALRQEGQVGAYAGLQSDSDGPTPDESVPPRTVRYQRFLRLIYVPPAVVAAVLAFLGASNNTYRWEGVVAWILAVGLFLIAFWKRKDSQRPKWREFGVSRDGWRLSWTTLAVIGLILIGFWFRFWRLDEMPSEMTSDHIEKLLDVHDLVTGQRPIFFVRNTGREPWQFYWTLTFIRLFDLETKFYALKLGTAAVGLLMLPGVYLLGRHLFGRWVGLWAMLFTAVASWPVILSRVGLRFPFAPAATAWSLFFLLRGLRDGRRNDFLLLGLWLGIGLHGYTAFRAMPVVVVLCWGFALGVRPASLSIHPPSLVRNALLTLLIAGVVFIPLGRFSLEHIDDFWRRSASRIADPNQSISDGPVLTFAKNLVNLALMFHWKGDDVWVNALSDDPALDPVLGGLLVLGLFMVLWRGWRLRDPMGPLLAVSGAVLLLPSALSLAYPVENPSVVRTGGAIPVVMIIAALPVGFGIERGLHALDAKRRTESHTPARMAQGRLGLVLLAVGALALCITVIGVNYQRYYGNYWTQFNRNTLNTTEIASAIHGFIESGGDPDNAWIIAWPYWIDTRGVGIELGDPPWNNVILKIEELDEQADTLAAASRSSAAFPRFYVLHPEDKPALSRLQALYPQGWPSIYDSERPDRSFVLYYVPQTSAQRELGDVKGIAGYAH